VRQPSSAAGLRTVPVRGSETLGGTPTQPAGEPPAPQSGSQPSLRLVPRTERACASEASRSNVGIESPENISTRRALPHAATGAQSTQARSV